MSQPRLAVASLDALLGTYRIVWDSQTYADPREPGSACDPRDGVLTLSRPELPPAWPKERSVSPTASFSLMGALTGPHSEGACAHESVVLRLCDSLLRTDRVASRLDRAALSGPPRAASPAPPRRPTSPLRSFPSSCSSSSTSSSSSSSSSSRAPGSPAQKRRTDLWRFDWDPAFPRLGYRFEGTDASAGAGHTLSFSEMRDDAGCPFAMLELRPAAGRAPIVVVAKRQRDRYGREGLSDAERVRIRMVCVDECRCERCV